MFRSKYYENLLNVKDKALYMVMCDNILRNSNAYYKKGLLISNLSQSSMVKKTGISWTDIRTKCIPKLDSLGILCKIESNNNCKYVLGVRTEEGKELLFIYYLIILHEKHIEKVLEETDSFNNPYRIVKLQEVDYYNNSLRDNIIDIVSNGGSKYKLMEKVENVENNL